MPIVVNMLMVFLTLQALEENLSSTTMASEEEDRVAEADLDANFEALAKHLQQRMVAIAAQSVSEETRLTTHHRWKSMKGKGESPDDDFKQLYRVDQDSTANILGRVEEP